MDGKEALARAVERAGGQTRLAKHIGVNQCVVSYWLKQSKRGAAGQHCVAIEELTGVPRHELRPDIYPAPQTEAAE